MRHHVSRGPFALVLALLSLLTFFASAAAADQVIGSPGTGAGQYEEPRGIAVDGGSEEIYVTDNGNHRIDVFTEAGVFLFAFGWNVNATDPEEQLQTCTALSGCQKGTSGPGAGQFGKFNRGGIAVDPTSHAVYITEDNHRLQKFDASGAFQWMVGGEVDRVTHANLCTVAADCGAGRKAEQAVGKEEGRFFETLGGGLPVAVGPDGLVYVIDSKANGPLETEGLHTRIQRFEPSGVYVGPQQVLPETVGRAQALAIDASGALYVASSSYAVGVREYGVRRYDPATGQLVVGWGEGGRVDPGGSLVALALDPLNDLFVADQGRTPMEIATRLLEYDPDGLKSLVFFGNGTLKTRPIALAPGATGSLFVAEEGSGEEGSSNNPARVVQISLPEPGPLLIPDSAKASSVGSVRATLDVSFNSENRASKAHFEYITKQQYVEDGESFGAGTQATPESPPSAPDFETHTAEASIACAVPTEASCLKPETTYYFRAVASSSAGEVTGEKAEFTTRPPVEIDATWATEVDTGAARLHAQVNPLGIDATGYFQYIAEGSDYQEHGFEHATDVPVGADPLDFGTGEAPLIRSVELTALQPGTVYHYRLIASDLFFPPVVSAGHAFITLLPSAGSDEECPGNAVFRTGASAALPDCRAYEMVSPLDKNNGDIFALTNSVGNPTFLDQSSTDGSGFTYSSYRAFADPKSAPYTNQLLSRRRAGIGWESESVDPKGLGSEFLENPFKAFSSDLASSWLSWFSRPGEATPDPCAPVGFTDLYRRGSEGAFQALSCAHIERFAAEDRNFLPEVQGFSADGTRTVFRADEALASGASSATTVNPDLRPIYQLYESTGAAQPRLLSVLPDGEASDEDSSAGSVGDTNAAAYWSINRFGSLLNAVSADGSRVFWSTGTGGGTLYLRTNADQAQSKVTAGQCSQATKACTIPVSETVSPEPARFQAADPQGRRALFTIRGNGPLAGNLYEFDSEAEPPTSQLIAGGVMESILGASEDLSKVYFVSEEATAQEQGEGASKGHPNVYLYEEGTTRFVATLSDGGGETSDVVNQFGTPNALAPIHRTARVSTDGAALVFMSNSGTLAERTAGYDNTDASSSAPCGKEGGICDAEVYRYDATAGSGTPALACLSCNPSGGRPDGRELELGNEGAIGLWGAATVPRFESQLYQPRYLSADGKRVFFNSFEGLVAGDTNGAQDVYEWEAAGEGSCREASPTYIVASAGCLRLISSGQGSTDSEFLDASPTGSDAFFTTAESLLPQDYGLIDVYDARVEGGFPPPVGQGPPCEGEACQGSLTPPDDPAPSSSTPQAAGNVKKPARARCRKGKGRRKPHCAADKHHKHHKHHKAAKRHSGRGANHDRRAGR